ncbi:MAG: hypothetical protein Q9224_002379, partial [Gallowayella concinna]
MGIVALVPTSAETVVKGTVMRRQNAENTPQMANMTVPSMFAAVSTAIAELQTRSVEMDVKRIAKVAGVARPNVQGAAKIQSDAMDYERRIGYYELFNVHERACDKVFPEDIEVAPLTHVNVAFVNFDSSFQMIDTDGDLISRVTFLKSRYQGLKVAVAIGGWAFNDPPTQTLFSDMASTVPNRDTFIKSLVSFMQKYGLDGVDIDWEYPAAPDRGGLPKDTDNFVLLMSDIRDAFNVANPAWEATLTVPTSYWYLRGFDVTRLAEYVDWFNVMSYDLHGMWDQHNRFTGPYLQGHTNISEIEQGLDLLWRNGITPNQVVFGFAFYGRSFTMSDPRCSKPGCTFATSGRPGDCTQTGGILSYSELSSRNSSLDVNTFYDEKSSVKYNVFNGDQWISYDDEQSFLDKKKYLTSRCLGGLMIWAIDQDTQNHDALSGLLGDFSSSQLEGGGLDDKSAAALSDAFGAFTGQNCFITPTCTDGTDAQKQKDQVCPSGTMSVSTAHSPLQAPGHDLHGACDEGWFRYICCPTKAMPENCKWNGAPVRSQFGCSGSCSKTQFLLNTDNFVDDKGVGDCFYGTRNLCCDSTQVLDECYWTGCQGPLLPETPASCDNPDDEYQTSRYDQDNGDFCSAAYVSPLDGAVGSPFTDRFKRGFCCPKGKGYQKCGWDNNPQPKDGQPLAFGDQSLFCQPQSCGKGRTAVTEALRPPPSPLENPTHTGQSCDGFTIPPGFSQRFHYCCQPPSKYSTDWPVDPKYLFEHYYNTEEDDVMWSYDNEYQNNNADESRSNPEDEDGKDAYGFVMLDGKPGSLDNEFPNSHTITRRTVAIPKIKRSILTSNKTIMDSTFEHSEETVYVYCNFPQESAECQKVWYKGAEDTIIRLPPHVGEGPYARIVSMELAESHYLLPRHHMESRSLKGNSNPVYKLKFDYDFHLIKRDDVVNMRVDFTNLLGYWDDLTDEPASKKKKRDTYADHLSESEWRSKIGKAKHKHAKLQKRRVVKSRGQTTTDIGDDSMPLERRWFGKFFDWLSRLNTVEEQDVGYLMLLKGRLNSDLNSSLVGRLKSFRCAGQTFSANMKLYLDADVEMEATYAYYFSGTIVPPAVTGTYAFFGLEPSAYLGLRMEGNARYQAGTGRKKLLDTISYPGLAIKGIAAVGPTLDLYGEIRGIVTLKGEMKAGAKLNFGKAEVYWPQDDAASDKYQTLLGVKSDTSAEKKELIAPTFDAKVKIDAAIDVLANLGLRIGGKISGGTPLVDAQIVGYVNTTLRFHASAKGTIGTNQEPTANYNYGVYLLYNIGYGAYATIKFFPNWALKPRNAFARSKQFTIYENSGSFLGPTKRSIDAPPTLPRRALIEDSSGTELSAPIHYRSTHGHRHEHIHGHRHLHQGSFDLYPNESSAINVQSLLSKRADDNSPLSSQAVNTAPLQCPPGATGQIRIPDYRLNCVLFQNAQLNGNGATAPVDGICPGVQGFYRRLGLANSDLTLTWDNDVSRANRRRDAACGRQYCTAQQSLLRNLIGDKTIGISCDEFPFASAEEGGNYVGTPSLTCVPAWQNTLQGNCNKLLLNGIATNVGYFERQQRGDTADSWANWDSSGWLAAGNLGSGPAQVSQRGARYPDQVAQGSGIDNNAYNQANGAFGWMFRRNFTFGLAELQSPTDGNAWTAGNNPAQSWTLRENGQFPPGTDGQDLSSIACAVNIFGQDNIFRQNFNALCYNGESINKGRGFTLPDSFSSCDVEFASGSGTTKRSMGQFNGWDVL